MNMMRPRFDLVKTAVAFIWTESGRGPFAVLTEDELVDFLEQYAARKIKTYVFRRVEGAEK